MNSKKAGNVVVALRLSEPDKVLSPCLLVVICLVLMVMSNNNGHLDVIVNIFSAERVKFCHFIFVDAVDNFS